MKIDTALVDRVASLARLQFDSEAKERFARQFAQIVSFVEQLNEVDTSGVEVLDIHGREENVLAGDEPCEGLGRERALTNAPECNDEFFLVPKVIDEE